MLRLESGYRFVVACDRLVAGNHDRHRITRECAAGRVEKICSVHGRQINITMELCFCEIARMLAPLNAAALNCNCSKLIGGSASAESKRFRKSATTQPSIRHHHA